MNFFLAAGSIGTWLDTTFADFDMTVFRLFGSIQNDILTGIAKVFTSLGETRYVALLGIVAIFLLFFRRTRKYGFSLIFAIAIGTLLTNVVSKPLVLRIRPYNTLQQITEYFGWYQGAGMLAESDYSFPSGHTTGAMEIAISMCLCKFSNKRGRGIAWLFPVVGLLVGCSRIYLMVHYATDVLAGLIIGLIAGIVGFLLGRLLTNALDRTAVGRACDLDRVYRKKTGHEFPRVLRAAICTFVWCAVFLASFLPLARAGGSEMERCAYHQEYQCYNEAQTGEKYPAIDGKHYCKIHWNQLSGSEEAAPVQTADPAPAN